MNEFVEVKTAELAGAALDWAVAIAESLTAFVAPPQYGNPHLVCVMPGHVHRGYYRYSPSTDWSQCGPLIESRKVMIIYPEGEQLDWEASATNDCDLHLGPTPLIAACRAIVASVLGETVSVPKELLS